MFVPALQAFVVAFVARVQKVASGCNSSVTCHPHTDF